MRDTYENVTVSEFKRCVSAWANASDRKYRTMLWVVGSQANKMGEDRYLSISDIRAGMKKALFALGDRSGWVPAERTIKVYLRELREAGVLETEQTKYQKRGKWVWGANIIRPNFDRILRDGNPEEWAFLSVLVDEDLPVARIGVDEPPASGLPPDGPLSRPRTAPALPTRQVLTPSTDSEYQKKSRERVSTTSAPGARRSSGGWSRTPDPKKPETAADLEETYGLDLRDLVNRYTFTLVEIVVSGWHFDWKQTARRARDRMPWTEYVLQRGGRPAMESELINLAKVKRVKIKAAF